MLISKGMVATLTQTLLQTLKTNQGAAGIILCVGTQPTDLQMDTLTAASSLVTANTACTFNTTGMQVALNSAAEFPPRYVLTSFPTVNTMTAGITGTINWAVITGVWGLAVVDVTAPNGGGLIEVNNVAVTSGVTPVTITNWSFKVSR